VTCASCWTVSLQLHAAVNCSRRLFIQVDNPSTPETALHWLRQQQLDLGGSLRVRMNSRNLVSGGHSLHCQVAKRSGLLFCLHDALSLSLPGAEKATFPCQAASRVFK